VFVVSADGLAITNYQVVGQFALRPERYRLSSSMAENLSGALELLAINAIHDLALVAIVAADVGWQRRRAADIGVSPHRESAVAP
jgi:serine protease Do